MTGLGISYENGVRNKGGQRADVPRTIKNRNGRGIKAGCSCAGRYWILIRQISPPRHEDTKGETGKWSVVAEILDAG